MGISTTANLQLPYPDGNELVSNGPSDFLGIAQILDAGSSGPVAMRSEFGTLGGRPLASARPLGHVYFCTDAACYFVRDNTTAWRYVALDGGTSPVGAVEQYSGSADPVDADGTTRWLVCDGRPISRVTYSTLWVNIGATWGSGNGSTTFNIPDLRGRAAVGAGTGAGLTARTLGQTGGEENHVLSTTETPAHVHVLAGAGSGAAANVSSVSVNAANANVTFNDAIHGHVVSDPGHLHPFFHNMPSSDAAWSFSFFAGGGIGFIPQTNTTGIHNDTSTNGAFTGVTVNGSWSGASISQSSHSHGVSDPGHGHNLTGSSQSTGGGTSHNNMQPYGVVNHIVRVL